MRRSHLGRTEPPETHAARRPPDNEQTWIQYLTDPNSNSLPTFEIKIGRQTKKVVFSGDCFHPNEKGATAYAEAVFSDTVRLGFDGEFICEDGQPSCLGVCCPEFWTCLEGICSNCNGIVCCHEDSCRGIPPENQDPNPLAYCSSTGYTLCVNDEHLCDGIPCTNDEDCQDGAYCLNSSCCGGTSRCIVRISCGS